MPNEIEQAHGGEVGGIGDVVAKQALLLLADRITPDMIAPLLQALIITVNGLNNGPNRQTLADGLRDALRKAAQ